jgi:threonine aldolase
LTDDLWRRNAQHANRMAQLLAEELAKIPQITITQKVEANGVFALIPRRYVPLLQKKYFFYIWNEEKSEVRLMTSFDTTEKDIADFVSLVKKTVR